MKRILIAAAMLLSACLCCEGKDKVKNTRPARDTSNDVCIRVDRIWSNGKYCAFTTLVKFNDTYYVAFREEDSHIWGDDGKAEGQIRVICSKDLDSWETVCMFHKEGIDLRDPNFTVTPDGRLMLSIQESVYEGKVHKSGHSYVAFSEDGKTYTDLIRTEYDNPYSTDSDWIWKVSWAGDTAYGNCYSIHETPTELLGSELCLLKTKDGVHYDFVTKLPFSAKEVANETCTRMLPDGRLAMVVRRDASGSHGYWGVSEAPYTKWKFTDMGTYVGGPYFIMLDDKHVILAARSCHMKGSYRTILLKGDLEGNFQEVCFLPSGGDGADTSYAGMLIEGDELIVSYYSKHETPKPSIYLARLPLSMFR